MNTRWNLLLLSSLSLSACDSAPPSSGDGGLVEPSLDGKNDEFNGVEDGGFIGFGDTPEQVFDADFQFYEYGFSARKNAVLDIEITQAGSSRGLDTTLFLYRDSPDGSAPTQIAFDDDAGWGTLSRIQDFRLYADGDYTVVVGTKGATGRGNFRLSLGCASDSCELEPPVCPERFEDSLMRCFEQQGAEQSYQLDAPQMVQLCEPWVEEDARCALSGDARCDNYDQDFASCVDVWDQRYVAPPVGIGLGTDSRIEAYEGAVRASDYCAPPAVRCTAAAASARWEGEVPSPESFLALTRRLNGFGPGAAMHQWIGAPGEFTAEDTRYVLGGLYGADAELSAVVDAEGLNLDEAVLHTTELVFGVSRDGNECSGTGTAAVFPSAGFALFLYDEYCWGE
ncbi:MAG: hypothetical protein ACRBN8_23385 [Nannocystales bacterium]